MKAEDERARIREVDRAIQARAIVESPLWDEAYTILINAEMGRMLARATSDEDTLECKRRIGSLQAVKDQLARIIETGRMAEMQLHEGRK